MKTILVNHGGNIQPKFIIRNNDDLIEYADIAKEINANHLFDTKNRSTNLQYMEIVSEREKISLLDSCIYVSNEKVMRLHKHIQEGKIIVVNMAGGYCFWDSDSMSIVDVKEVNTNLNGSENCIQYIIKKSKFLVLENQDEIPIRVTNFLCKEDSYSCITNIRFDHNKQLNGLIKDAICNGCDTIVAESTLMGDELILQLVELFDKLPSMTFELFLSADLNSKLIYLIGEERTDGIYNKHKIITH